MLHHIPGLSEAGTDLCSEDPDDPDSQAADRCLQLLLECYESGCSSRMRLHVASAFTGRFAAALEPSVLN